MFPRLSPLFPYLRRYWPSYVWGTLSLILYNSAKAMIPRIVGRAIDDMKIGLNPTHIQHQALLLLGVAVVSAICLYLSRQILIGASREIEYDLRNDLFAHLSAQQPSFFQRHRTGDIMARSTNDLNAVRQLLGPAIMYSANALFFTVIALPFMFKMSPRLTLIAFVPLPFACTLVQYFGSRIHKRFERIQAMFSDISAQAEENFSGARLIRAFAQEEAQIAAFEESNHEYIRRSLLLARLMAMLWPTLEFCLGIALMLTLFIGGREVVQGHLTVGDFASYNVYMVQLIWPMIAIGWVVNLVQRGAASVVRIHELMLERPTIDDSAADPAFVTASSGQATNRYPEASASGLMAPEGNGVSTPGVSSSLAGAITQLHGHITFNHLNFSYITGPEVLHDITLDIPAGTSLAIVGPTGSGKSTLVSLIPRLQDAPAGSVLLDGRPLRDYPLATLRHAIGFVPQETFLFSTTIAGNIAFGVEEAAEPAIEDAAATAHIATEIREFPAGFQTIVGERGMTLSGGQKQRTAIARAILRDPRILILDDALASVDTYTEEQILTGLAREMQGRTTILIAHRVSTARNADRIAVLIDGRITELGTHDELLARNGYYTELFEKQSLEEEILTA